MRLRTVNKRAKRRPWVESLDARLLRYLGNYTRELYPYRRSTLLSILDHEQQPARLHRAATLRWARSEPEPLWLGGGMPRTHYDVHMVTGKRTDRAILDDLTGPDFGETELRVVAHLFGASLETEKATVHRLLYGQSPAVDEEAEGGEASDVG